MKKTLLLCILSFVTIMASAQLTYDFNKKTGVLTIGGDGTTVTNEDVTNAIGRDAYQKNHTLKEVIFTATGVTTIGEKAFHDCFLTSITLPDGLTTIGDNAFYYCQSLTSITLPEAVTTIGNSAFYYCQSLTSITLPEAVTTIGNSAFSDCESLTSITLPDGLTTIGDNAFYYCYSLTNITLPEAVTTIGNSAFYYCQSLTSITLPDGLTTIGDNAFKNCKSLTNILVSSQNAYFTSVDGVLFDKQKKVLLLYPIGREETSYIVPKGTETIGDNAFYLCKSLTSITLPDGLTSIGDYAFFACVSLTSITLLDGLTTIGTSAFSLCESLTSITLPDGLTTIGYEAFKNCDSLTSITLPNGLTTIGGRAFYSCSLTNITIPEAVTTIGNSAFENCYSLTSILVSSQNAYFTSVNGVLFDKQKKVLLTYPNGRKEASYIVPKGTETIGRDAFFSIASLTSIILPDGLTTIGMSNFYGCDSLTDITCLSATEPKIDTWTFQTSLSYRTVYVPNATSGFTPSKWGDDYDTNVTIKYGEYPTGIQESVATSGFSTRVVNGSLFIEGLKPGTAYTVMGTNGSLIAKGIATAGSCQVKVSGRGICIIHAAGISRKVVYE